jgi:hypothetical protein
MLHKGSLFQGSKGKAVEDLLKNPGIVNGFEVNK